MDECVRWFERKLEFAVQATISETKSLIEQDEYKLAFYEFIDNEDIKKLYAYRRNGALQVSIYPPYDFQGKSVFFLKKSPIKITPDNINFEVSCIEGSSSLLNHTQLLLREVFLPSLCAKPGAPSSAASDVGEATSTAAATNDGLNVDKLSDFLHRLMAAVESAHHQAQGDTVLPLPSLEVLTQASETRGLAVVHILETTVVNWMKQIRSAIRSDPIEQLHHKYGPDAGPLAEIAVWRDRHRTFENLQAQLERQEAIDIMSHLQSVSSAYAAAFDEVVMEIDAGKQFAQEILKYLSPMEVWVTELREARTLTEKAARLKPILRLVLLLWSNHSWYHQGRHLSNLLQLISNEVVQLAIQYVGNDVLKDPLQSFHKLKDVQKLCAAFKGAYVDCREEAEAINKKNVAENLEKMNNDPTYKSAYTAFANHMPKPEIWSVRMYGPHKYTFKHGLKRSDYLNDPEYQVDSVLLDSPWPPRNAPCFALFNAFMERCTDCLELVQTTQHFRLLADAAEIGGAGSQSLDAIVREIHEKYRSAMNDFFEQVTNVLDLDRPKEFERAFFDFRTVVRELERCLARILSQSLQQCPTVLAQLRLLEVFEGISGREIVQEVLKDKDELIVKGFIDDLMVVQEIFRSQRSNTPSIRHMPRFVSTLYWLRGLRQRLEQPWLKIHRVSPHMLTGELGYQLKTLYAEVFEQVTNEEAELIREWQEGVTDSLFDYMKNSLLVCKETGDLDQYEVNLDPRLVRLLREMRHVTGEPFNLGLTAAGRRLARLADLDKLRSLAARLDTIVSTYNGIMQSLTESEFYLLQGHVVDAQQLFRQGCTVYTWKLEESADFIERSHVLVLELLAKTLRTLKSNCDEIRTIADAWTSGVLDIFQGRASGTSYEPEQLQQMHRQLTDGLEARMQPSNNRIHALVESSFQSLGISKASPVWLAYVRGINEDIVFARLKDSVMISLDNMANCLAQAALAGQHNPNAPILTVRLDLVQGSITFRPPLDEKSYETSVTEMATSWISDFLGRAGLLTNLLAELPAADDQLTVDERAPFLEKIQVDVDVEDTRAKILEAVKENSANCINYVEYLNDYRYLWVPNIAETFQQFLQGRASPNPARTPSRSMQNASSTLFPTSRSRPSSVRSRLTGQQEDNMDAENAGGELSLGERAFLTPKSSGQAETCVPSLAEFQDEIELYLEARREIQDMPDSSNQGWLLINMRPLKEVLITLANKWVYQFTSYLTEQVLVTLRELDEFLQKIEPQIESISGQEKDTYSFMRLMRLFNEISSKQVEMDARFDVMRRTIRLLNTYECELPEEIRDPDGLQSVQRWQQLKNKVISAKQKLGPRIHNERRTIENDLANFQSNVQSLSDDLFESNIFNYSCLLSKVQELLADFSRTLRDVEEEAQDLREVQTLLGTEVIDFNLIAECRETLDNLKLTWETVRLLLSEQADWKKQRWKRLSPSQLAEACGTQLARLERLPEQCHDWDVFAGICDEIAAIRRVLELIDQLKDPAMKPRHWKQLVRLTGGVIQINSESLEAMTLGELLKLGLQNNADHVTSIVKRAKSDKEIEEAIKNFDNLWMSKVFDLKLHYITPASASLDDQVGRGQNGSASGSAHRPSISRMSGRSAGMQSVASLPSSLIGVEMESDTQIYLLDNTDKVFAELAEHQASLADMLSSSTAGSYVDDIGKWQRTLQHIETVLILWLRVQEKWLQLQNIYEAEQAFTALPEYAKFQIASADFKRLMQATKKNQNLLQCCNRKYIVPILDRMDSLLRKCREEIVSYLDARIREKFPRFHFLSAEDLFLVYGSCHDAELLNRHIGKLFENIGELVFTRHEDNPAVCEVTGVRSRLGEELPLAKPVVCRGLDCSWLGDLLEAIRTALKLQLAASFGEGADAANAQKKESHLESMQEEETGEQISATQNADNENAEGKKNDDASRPQSQHQSTQQLQHQQHQQQQPQSILKRRLPKNDREALAMLAGEPISSVFHDTLERLATTSASKQQEQDEATSSVEQTASTLLDSVAEVCHLRVQIEFSAQIDKIVESGTGSGDEWKNQLGAVRAGLQGNQDLCRRLLRLFETILNEAEAMKAQERAAAAEAAISRAVSKKAVRLRQPREDGEENDEGYDEDEEDIDNLEEEGAEEGSLADTIRERATASATAPASAAAQVDDSAGAVEENDKAVGATDDADDDSAPKDAEAVEATEGQEEDQKQKEVSEAAGDIEVQLNQFDFSDKPVEDPMVKIRASARVLLVPAQQEKLRQLIRLYSYQIALIDQWTCRNKDAEQDADEEPKADNGNYNPADLWQRFTDLWTGELRYTRSEDGSVQLHCCGESLSYGWEYIGSAERRPQDAKLAGNLIHNVKNRFPTLCHSDNSESGSCGGSMELFSAVWHLAVWAGRPLYCVACSPVLPDRSLEYAFQGLARADGVWLCLRSIDTLCLETANKLARLLSMVTSGAASAAKAQIDEMGADADGSVGQQQQQQEDQSEASMSESSACFCTLGGTGASKKQKGDSVPFAVRPIVFEQVAAELPVSILNRLVPLRITEPSSFTQRAFAEAKLDLIGFRSSRVLADRLVDFLASYRSICDRLEDSFADCDREFRPVEFLSQAVDAAERHYPKQVELHLNNINVRAHNQYVLNQRMRTEMSSLMAQSEPRPEPLTQLPDNLVQEVQSHSLLLGLRDLLAPAFRRQSEGQLFEQLAVELFPGCPPSLDFRETGRNEERFETPKSEDAPVVGAADTRPTATATSTNVGARRTTEVVSNSTAPMGLVAALERVLHDDLFVHSDAFECNLTKLYNMAEHSNAIAIIGPSGVGKTTVFRAYERLMQLMKVPLQVQCLYPGALSTEELVGKFENGRWQPSVLGAILNQFAAAPSELGSDSSTERNILRLDGTCSAAQWEVLQSLLDKPDFITLLSGEKVIFSDPVRVAWEMETLEDCSPGLASRVQIMFVAPDPCPVPPFLTRWLDDRQSAGCVAEAASLIGVFDKYLPALHRFVSEAMKQPTLGRPAGGLPRLERLINQSYDSSLRTTQRLLESQISSASLHQLRDEDYEQLFVFAALWGFGANLTPDSQQKMSEWWRANFANERAPQQGSLFEYYLDVDRMEWQPWQELIPMYQGTINSGIPTHAFVHTPSSQAVSHCLSLLSDQGAPVLLVGPRGCGKSAIVGERIRTVCSSEVSEILNVSVYANRYTNARIIAERLDEKLEWKDGKLYVPLGGKRLMCFVDDLNLATTDDSGRQTSSELLRQLIDEGWHHFAATQSWRTLKSLHFIAALNPNVAGGATIRQRFVNHFSVLAVNYPSQAEQCRLFSTMIMAHFFQPSESAHTPEEIRVMHSYGPDRSIRSLLDQLVKVTVDLQENLRSMFLLTARRSHYVFSLRTLSTVFRNMCQSLNSDAQKQQILNLWRNECDWVFAERMVDYVDKDRYRRAFANAVKKQFADEYKLADELMEILLQPKPPMCSSIALQDSGLVSAISTKTQNDPDWTWGDGYATVSSNDRLRELISDAIAEFNKNNPKIRLPLYNRTLAEVSRIARTLLSPHNFGHIAIVAEGNPGMSALLARLSAHLAGFKVIQSTPASLTAEGHSKVEQFKRDLVAAYTNAGVKEDLEFRVEDFSGGVAKNEKLMFLLRDHEILEDSLFVYLSEFIIHGNINHLFTPEEQTKIVNSVRTDVTQAGLTYNKDVAWEFFLSGVRRNFRICLIVTDTDQPFHRLCQQFPVLISTINFIWLQHWHTSQLVEHAAYHLESIEWLKEPLVRENLAHLLASMHLALRRACSEPAAAAATSPRRGQQPSIIDVNNTSYSKFVEKFCSLAATRHVLIEQEHRKAEATLNQIQQESALANKLRAKLEHERTVQRERQSASWRLLYQIGQDTAITQSQMRIVRRQMGEITKLKKLLPEYSLAHERAVYKSLAIIKDTQQVVQDIDKDSLAQLRAEQKPTPEVQQLMEAVILALKGPEADNTWQKGAKRQMANIDRFLEELQRFSEQDMPIETLEMLQDYVSRPDVQPERLTEPFVACQSLAKWIGGVARYQNMMHNRVRPLHRRMEETAKRVAEAETRNVALEQKRVALEARLKELAVGFEEATIDKNSQDEKTRKMEEMLATAKKLRRIMRQELRKCQRTCRSLTDRVRAIPGACAIAAGLVTYLGRFEQEFRQRVLTAVWPECLRERGLQLAIDTVDPISGREILFKLGVVTQDDENEDQEDAEDEEEEDAEMEKAQKEEIGEKERARGSAEAAEGRDLDKDEDESEARPPPADEDPVDNENLGGKQQHDHDDPAKESSSARGGLEEEKEASSVLSSAAVEDQEMDSELWTRSRLYRYYQALCYIIVGESTAQNWYRQDLSAHQLINAAIIRASTNRPVCFIDPHSRGRKQELKHLLTTDTATELIQIDMNQRRETTVLDDVRRAITEGRPLLMYNLNDNLDNLFEPLVHYVNMRDPSDQDEPESHRIRFYQRKMLCGHNFLPVFATGATQQRLLSPDFSSQLTLVNCVASRDSLGETLKRRAFAKLWPEKLGERSNSLDRVAQLRVLLAALVRRIRSQLAGALNSQSLWSEDSMRAMSNTAKRIDAVSAATRREQRRAATVERRRDLLASLGADAADVYSALRGLGVLQFEYRYPLHEFLRLFDLAVDPDGGEPLPEDFEEVMEAGKKTKSLDARKKAANSLAPQRDESEETTADEGRKSTQGKEEQSEAAAYKILEGEENDEAFVQEVLSAKATEQRDRLMQEITGRASGRRVELLQPLETYLTKRGSLRSRRVLPPDAEEAAAAAELEASAAAAAASAAASIVNSDDEAQEAEIDEAELLGSADSTQEHQKQQKQRDEPGEGVEGEIPAQTDNKDSLLTNNQVDEKNSSAEPPEGWVNEAMTRLRNSVYNRFGPSLFHEDRLLFGLLLRLTELPLDDGVPLGYLDFLFEAYSDKAIRSFVSTDSGGPQRPAFCPPDRWDDIVTIGSLDGPWATVHEAMANDADGFWSGYCTGAAEEATLAALSTKRTRQREDLEPRVLLLCDLLLLKLLRPDRLLAGIEEFLTASENASAPPNQGQQQRQDESDTAVANDSGANTSVTPAMALTLPSLSEFLDDLETGLGPRCFGTLVLLPNSAIDENYRDSAFFSRRDLTELLGKAAQIKGRQLVVIDYGARSEQQALDKLERVFNSSDASQAWILLRDSHCGTRPGFQRLERKLRFLFRSDESAATEQSRQQPKQEEATDQEQQPQQEQQGNAQQKQQLPIVWLTYQIGVGNAVPATLIRHMRVVSSDYLDGIRPEDTKQQQQQKEATSIAQCDRQLLLAGEAAFKQIRSTPFVDNVQLLRLGYVHSLVSYAQRLGARHWSRWQMVGDAALAKLAGLLADKDGGELPANELMSRLYEHLYSRRDTRKLLRHWLTEVPNSGLCPQPAPNSVETLEFLRDWSSQASLLNDYNLLPWERSPNRGAPAGLALAACMQRLYVNWVSNNPPPTTSLWSTSLTSSALPSVFECEIRPASRLAKLFTVLDLVSESLPPLVRFNSEADSRQFSFAYHPPSSAASSASVSSTGSLTDDRRTRTPSVEVVQRECAIYNRQILAVGRDVQLLRRHLPAGAENLPSSLAASASRLATELVPEDWLHRSEQPNSLPLTAWLARLRRRHAQLRRLRPTGLIGSLWLGGLYEPGRLLAAMRLDKRLTLSGAVHRYRLEDVRLRCELLPAAGSNSRLARAGSGVGGLSSALQLENVYMCGMQLAESGGEDRNAARGSTDAPKLVFSERNTVSRLEGYNLLILFESAQVEEDQGNDELLECEIYTTWSKQHHVATVLLSSSVKPPDSTERGFFILDPGFIDGAYPTRPRVPIVRTPLVDEVDPLGDDLSDSQKQQQQQQQQQKQPRGSAQRQRLEGIDEEDSAGSGAPPSSKRESDQASYRPFSPQASTRPESLQLQRDKPMSDENGEEDQVEAQSGADTPVATEDSDQEAVADKNQSAYRPEVSNITEKAEDEHQEADAAEGKNDEQQQEEQKESKLSREPSEERDDQVEDKNAEQEQEEQVGKENETEAEDKE